MSEDIENSIKTSIINTAQDGVQGNKFVVTPDYIQQSEYANYLLICYRNGIKPTLSYYTLKPTEPMYAWLHII